MAIRNELTEEQITNLMQSIPRAEEVDRLREENRMLRAENERLGASILSLAKSLRASLDAAIRQRDEARAEIERLRADLAIKQNCCDGAAAQDAHIRQEREEHRVEVEKQRAENERLRAMLPPTAHSGVRNGPGEGSWSVYAAKVTEERDAARAEVDRLRAEIERLSDVLRRVAVYPSGDRTAKVAFVSEGCMVSFPIHPQTTWALEVLIEFDQARRNALEGKP